MMTVPTDPLTNSMTHTFVRELAMRTARVTGVTEVGDVRVKKHRPTPVGSIDSTLEIETVLPRD